MNKNLFALIGLMFLIASTAFAGVDDPRQVGGGIVGNVSSRTAPTMGAGWEVGSGQVNGNFVLYEDTNFSSPDGNGIQLGMRTEQRRVGAVTPAPGGGGDYTVQAGDDPGTGNRAWWNFQHSIAYDGNIDDLDSLCFTIETHEGSSIPVEPANMLELRSVIDDRNGQPNPTDTFSDLYQTSQNPVFGWFEEYDMFEEPASWRLYLTAAEGKDIAEVSMCVHTPAAVCDPLPDSAKKREQAARRRAAACR